MAAPKKLTRDAIEDAPYEIWNAFVSIVFLPYEKLDAVQRVGHHAMWYDSELNNGGHLQYFENHGVKRVGEVIQALHDIGADRQADVLSRAVKQRQSRSRNRIRTVKKYVESALAGEYDELDREYYECRPKINELLERYLEEHESSFVVRVK